MMLVCPKHGKQQRGLWPVEVYLEDGPVPSLTKGKQLLQALRLNGDPQCVRCRGEGKKRKLRVYKQGDLKVVKGKTESAQAEGQEGSDPGKESP